MGTTGYSAAVDTNDLIMSFIAEATWADTPATPAFKTLRLDGEGFSSSKSRTRPNEISADGQATAAITTKEESTGSLNFSVSASDTSNELLASAVNGVWTTPVDYVGSDVAITVADGTTCTLTATAGDFLDSNLVIPGQFLKVFSADASGGCFIGRVLTVAADTLTFDCCSQTMAVILAAAMGACTIKGSCLRNGTTVTTFTIEKKLAADLYLRYVGAFPNEGSLEVGVGDYLKGSLSFLNKSETAGATAIAGATYAAPTIGTVIDSVRGIGTVWRGATAIAGIVQKLSMKWTKEGAAAQYGIGSAAAVGIRSGKMLVTGSVSTFFANLDLYNEYLAESTDSISFYAIDGLPTASATRGYVLTFCNASIMNPKVVAGSANADFMADFEIEGAPDDSAGQLFAGKTLQIDYFS
jgi:hypothetical protein